MLEFIACRETVLLAKCKNFLSVCVGGDALSDINAEHGKLSFSYVQDIITAIKDLVEAVSCILLFFFLCTQIIYN